MAKSTGTLKFTIDIFCVHKKVTDLHLPYSFDQGHIHAQVICTDMTFMCYAMLYSEKCSVAINNVSCPSRANKNA